MLRSVTWFQREDIINCGFTTEQPRLYLIRESSYDLSSTIAMSCYVGISQRNRETLIIYLWDHYKLGLSAHQGPLRWLVPTTLLIMHSRCGR
ncbi:hypothetical protein J6590_106125 [Homalodisca vitripennis]|nr:hypothetical protein J6590_084090 [Homalodisca vitripennis]KAG8303946.1 hypothetical protein J6590_106125 [Homalodisca vitripennis]